MKRLITTLTILCFISSIGVSQKAEDLFDMAENIYDGKVIELQVTAGRTGFVLAENSTDSNFSLVHKYNHGIVINVVSANEAKAVTLATPDIKQANELFKELKTKCKILSVDDATGETTFSCDRVACIAKKKLIDSKQYFCFVLNYQ